MESAYASFDEDLCNENAEDGGLLLDQQYCECPGFEPICGMCDGDLPLNPDAEYEYTDDSGEEIAISCLNWHYITITTTEEDECLSDAAMDYLEGELCGCPKS